MTIKERAQYTVEALEAYYPEVKCSLHYTTPLEMLLATQMSAQCTDASVNRVTQTLFKKYKSVDDFANADLEELEADIHSIGLYHNKAKNIIKCCQQIRDNFAGEVPNNMEDLLTLAGTGRKTANLILGEIFQKPAVVVDTHCIRLTNRIGLVKTKKPEEIEQKLRQLLPKDKQLATCHRFVWLGRELCTARSPKCDKCPLDSICSKKI